MKRLLLLFQFVLLLSVASCSHTPTDTTNIKGLTALAQLWGFLKYHHPSVAAGLYDWDAELMKRIPAVQNAPNDEEWKSMLDTWIDSLPPVTPLSGKALPPLEVQSAPDYGELFNTQYFLPQTIEKIRYILDNATITSNHYVSINHGMIDFSGEKAYNIAFLPDTSYRLLALFRHWNIVNYFFPYRNLCDQKWAEVLPEMIPEFIHTKDALAYYKACQKLHAKIDDSHGFYRNEHYAFIKSRGVLHPPFKVRFIENKLTVVHCILKDTCTSYNIQAGDVITAVNGVPTDSILKKEIPYNSASNHTTKLRNIASYMLQTNARSSKLSILRGNEKMETTVHCYPTENLRRLYETQKKSIDGYQIIQGNIGYVYPANCTARQRNEGIRKVLAGTRGLIIDFRCYPGDYISYPFLRHLNQRPFPTSWVTFMDVAYPGFAFIVNKSAPPIQKIIKKENAYDKKIVVIVNEETQSQAEDNVLGFQLATNVTVIGSTTAGANGAVTRFTLPGGITTSMSGKGVYYPDGSNLQRAGVKIDEVVVPTIQGIRSHKDELLERAIEIIQEHPDHP